MGYYYNDPTGLGSWYVSDGQTPAQAITELQRSAGAGLEQLSPLLQYSIENNPTAQQVKAAAPPTPPKPLVPIIVRKGMRPKIISTGPQPVNGGCPPGYEYDNFNQICVPIGQDPVCGAGYVLDLFNSICIPVDVTVGSPGGPVGQGATGLTNVNVVVNNAVQFAQAALDNIASAVQTGIQTGLNTAAQVASDDASIVTDHIAGLTQAIGNGVSSLLDSLKSGLEYIGNLIYTNIGKLVGFITDHIGKVVDAVSSAVQTVADVVKNTIAPAIQSVTDTLNKTVVPIFHTLSDVYQQTVALIGAIKADVSNGITGLLQLPADLANSLSSVEASILRGIDQLGLKAKTGTSVFTSEDGRDTIWSRLDHIGRGIASIGGADNAKITYADVVRLSEPDLGRAGAANVNALVGEITDFVKSLMAGRLSVTDAAKAALPLGLPFLGAEVGTWIGVWELFRAVEELFEPFYEFARDEIKAKSGLAKLPVGQVLEAHRRGIVNDKDLAEDLAVNGWDSGRIAVLKDLQVFLVDIGTSIDMLHRGIITDEEANNSLRKHGVSGDQMAALKAQSVRLFDANLAEVALRWQLITEKDFDAALKRLRYTDEEITVRKVVMFERESVQDVLNRHRVETLYSSLGFSPSDFATVPADVLAAAARSGQSAQVATDIWEASFYVHPIDRWVELYFRGLRTRPEVDAAMAYYRVPAQFRDDIIREHQALIPFRTIPTMLANGVIDEAYAKQQLQAHGFDLQATEALLKYATVAHKKSKVAASGDVFGLSVAVAKGYFDSGAITAEQYKEVLLAHGYDEASADFTVTVETQHAMMLARHQLASDLVAEVKSGVMSIEQAENMMDANQFSQAEKSRVLNNINRMKRSNAKVPNEGELHSMASHDAISVDEYRSGMIANGWGEPWLTAFITWRFPHATLIASAR